MLWLWVEIREDSFSWVFGCDEKKQFDSIKRFVVNYFQLLDI